MSRRGRALGAALLLLAPVAACGEEPSTSPGPSSSSQPSASSQAREVAVLSASAAGGRTGEPVLLDEAGVSELVAGLGRGLPAQVREVVARTDVPEGQALVGAVVAVGCEAPTAVEVEEDGAGQDGAGLRLVAVLPARKTPVQCLVPVTSVGIVLVDAARAAGLG